MELKVQKSLLDLATFEDVTLVKVGTFEPVSDIATALSRLNGDSAKLLEVVNDGLRAHAMDVLRNDDSAAWHTFKVDAEGEETQEVNGPFAGSVGKPEVVNPLVLTLAKTMFGFGKDMTKAQKQAAKQQAKDFIKGNPAILAGLVKSSQAGA